MNFLLVSWLERSPQHGVYNSRGSCVGKWELQGSGTVVHSSHQLLRIYLFICHELPVSSSHELEQQQSSIMGVGHALE